MCISVYGVCMWVSVGLFVFLDMNASVCMFMWVCVTLFACFLFYVFLFVFCVCHYITVYVSICLYISVCVCASVLKPVFISVYHFASICMCTCGFVCLQLCIHVSLSPYGSLCVQGIQSTEKLAIKHSVASQ